MYVDMHKCRLFNNNNKKLDVMGGRDRERIVPNLGKVKKLIEEGQCYTETQSHYNDIHYRWSASILSSN